MSRGVLLVAIWLLAWGEVSVGNVLTGVLLAAVLLVAFPPRRDDTPTLRRVRPLPMLRLVAYVARQLLVSNLDVTRRILSRHPRTNPGIVDLPLDHPSDLVVTSITSIISLAPGTMTVDVTEDPQVLRVHVLVLDDPEGARRRLEHLIHLTSDAFGEGARP